MSVSLSKIILSVLLITLVTPLPSPGKDDLKLYPYLYSGKPGIPSPYITPEGREIITLKKGDRYQLVDMTRENGNIYSCMHFLWGKGKQLLTAGGDFPALEKTGLHNEPQLLKKKYITGREIGLINYLARPGRFSRTGFIASSEDIISVLIRDNKTVKKLGLKHTDLAKPLFHVWNIIQGNFVRDRWARDITFLYNGHELILNAEGGKGYQESIFHDEIEGRWNISVRRQLTVEEIRSLRSLYENRTEIQFKNIVKKLSRIDISEMNPYYIQRYGFYEGNTAYRADPVSIAFIFGLKSMTELIKVLGSDLSAPIIGGIH